MFLFPGASIHLLQSYWEESIKWEFVSKATDLTRVLSQGKNDTATLNFKVPCTDKYI